MIKFLSGTEILIAVRELVHNAALKNDESVDLAVAYWGDGAINRLGLDGKKKVRILCDLLGGSCNPFEVEKFLRSRLKKHIEIRHLDGFHAKVYASPSETIVGSANSSANGLGLDQRDGTIEGAIQTDDEDVINDVKCWFEKHWAAASKSKLSEPLLRLARENWAKHPLEFSPEETVLGVLLGDPTRFRNRVVVGYYEDSPTPLALKKYRAICRSRYSDYELAKYEADEVLPIYQLDGPESKFDMCGGDFSIDCDDDDAEIWQLLAQPTVPISKDDCIILATRRTNLGGLRFPRKERKILAQAMRTHHKNVGKANTVEKLDRLPTTMLQSIRDQVDNPIKNRT